MAKKKTSDLKPLPVNEPVAEYGNKRLHFFSSFEEQENDNFRWLASLSPVENLGYALSLIKQIFAKELIDNPTLGNKIKFDK